MDIAPQEWEACLESWITLTTLYLRTAEKDLPSKWIENPSATAFLKSMYHECAERNATDQTLRTTAALKLRRNCFYLFRRLLLSKTTSPDFMEMGILGDFARTHGKNAALPRLFKEVLERPKNSLEKSLQKAKAQVIASLESKTDIKSVKLKRLVAIFQASPDAANLFITGSDFLDALAERYIKTKGAESREILVVTAYSGLAALAKAEPVNLSMLSDHLYSLQAQADATNLRPSLLADLVTNTGLIKNLRQLGSPGSSRLSKLLDTIETYQDSDIIRRHQRRLTNKGKAKAADANGEMHMHRMSLVTQVQDLFPDLGTGFVLQLLDEYQDDVEQVTAHLLDDSLPPHLQGIDRAASGPAEDIAERPDVQDLEPHPTPPLEPYIPDRRNIFDNDELDRLDFDIGRLHLGKREQTTEYTPNKAAILSALAAFDSDDDERDDTYDVEDVGGTVDTAHPDGEPGPSAKVTAEENEMALFTAYTSSPEMFGRTFNVRRGQARHALKAETGMTDEQIEGWAVMLQRDPRRLKRLQEQANMFDGRQAEIGRTSYRESPAGTETEDSDVPAGRGGYRGRGRGRGRGGKSRGGDVAGPSSDPTTVAAQRRKEANKSSRANRNRRDQRARKMARGGFSG